MKFTYKKYLKLSLIITLYSGLSLLAINCGGTQSTQGTKSTQQTPGIKSQVTSIHEQVKNNALIEQLKAAAPKDYEKIIKDAIQGQSDAEKKKILSQTDEQGSTIGHFLAAHSPLDAALLKEICKLDSENCTKINNIGEASFDIAYANKNLSKDVVDTYLSYAGVGAKFKDDNNFLQKIIKSNSNKVPERNNIIEFLLSYYPGLYNGLEKKTIELFISNNFKNLDADLFSALKKDIGRSDDFNNFANLLYKESLAQLAKDSEIAKLISRPDVKDADANNDVNTSETGLYKAVPDSASELIRDTYRTLRQIVENSSAKYVKFDAVKNGLTLIHSPLKEQLLDTLKLYLENSRLAAIKAKKTKPTGLVPDFIEWSDGQKWDLGFANTDKEAGKIDVPNKAHLYDEKALINKYISSAKFKNIITAQTLESIPKDKVADITYIFLNMNKAGWKNPIVGEVKYVNDRRYQFIGQPDGDEYGVVVGVDDFGKLITGFPGGTTYKIQINKTWSDSDETKLSSGAAGTIYEVKYNNRIFVAKQNMLPIHTDKEILAYERLHGIEGIGPYLGQIQYKFILLEKGEPLDTFAISNKDLAEPFMKSLLKTMGKMHDRGIFHNDIKINNIIVVNDKPNIIDFGSQSKADQKLGHGFTPPYYKVGEMSGVKADLGALAFVFFALKHFGEDAYKDSFIDPEKGKIILQGNLVAKDIAARLEKGDKVDKVIANMLQQKYSSASEALSALK